MSSTVTYRDYEIVLELGDDQWYFSVYGDGKTVRQTDRGYPKYDDAVKSAKRLVDDVIKHPHAYGYH